MTTPNPTQTTLTDHQPGADSATVDGVALEVETTTPAVVEDPDGHNPFAAVDDGTLTLPDHDDWECSGTVHQPETDDHSITWAGDHPVPGYEWSEKALVVVETTTSSDTYTLALYPFDADESFPGVIQPRLIVDDYERLRPALANVASALSVLADREPGEPVAIDGINAPD